MVGQPKSSPFLHKIDDELDWDSHQFAHEAVQEVGWIVQDHIVSKFCNLALNLDTVFSTTTNETPLYKLKKES